MVQRDIPSSPQCNSHVQQCAQQDVLLHDVGLEAEPCPIQTGVKVSVTIEVSGSKQDVLISNCMDNHKDEEEDPPDNW